MTRGAGRKKFKSRMSSKWKSANTLRKDNIAREGVKATGDHQCPNSHQRFDNEQAKKLLHRLESGNFPIQKGNNLKTLTWMRKTSQPIHDGAHKKPEEIDEAGTSGTTAQIISPLHAQVWLRGGFKNSRMNTRARRDTGRSRGRAYLKNQEEKCAKFFPRKSRKERNKCKKAENGNTNELTLISANVTS